MDGEWKKKEKEKKEKGELPAAVCLSPPVFLCARCGAAAPRLSRSSIAGETASLRRDPPRESDLRAAAPPRGEPVSLSVPPGFGGRIGDW